MKPRRERMIMQSLQTPEKISRKLLCMLKEDGGHGIIKFMNMCNVFKIRVSKSLWKVRRSLLVLRSVSEGQMCSLCRWDTFLSGPRSSQVFWYLQQLSVISSLLSGRDESSLDRALGRGAWSPYHTTNNTPLHHKICDGKRENSPSPKYRTDTDRELTTW